jgi:hypothetical protein
LGLQLSNLKEGFIIKKTTPRICSFAIVFFMNFELGVLFFDEKRTNLSHAYEGIGILVDEWNINPINLLGGHGNQKIVYSAVIKGMG